LGGGGLGGRRSLRGGTRMANPVREKPPNKSVRNKEKTGDGSKLTLVQSPGEKEGTTIKKKNRIQIN